MPITCPKCGSKNVYVARDMKSTRRCGNCRHSWLPAQDAQQSAAEEREALDQRCGFGAGNILSNTRSPEWLAACNRLAQRYDYWKMPDQAARIRLGEPGWLIEQACVEALLASQSPDIAHSAEGEVA